MTDTTAGGRGGVGIRLFTTGGEVVKRTFDQIGDSGKKMWAEIALGEKSANPAIRSLSSLSAGAKDALGELTTRAGVAGQALSSFGVLGVAAAAAIGAAIMASITAMSAMRDAADMTDTADRIGIGTEALQEWRYAADEAGVSISSMEQGLEKLNGLLGRFKMGIADGKLKPVFEELGISKAMLDDVRTADELLMLLADRLGQVQDRSKQVALARSLQIEQLLPLLRMGSDGLKGLRDEAQALGFVVDNETTASLDRAERQIERAKQQMDVLRTQAVAPLAVAFGDAAVAISNFMGRMNAASANAPRWYRNLAWGLNAQVPGGAVMFGRNLAAQSGGGQRDITVEDMRAFIGSDSGSSGFELQGHTRGGGGRGARGKSAEQLQAEAERRAEQIRQREERYQEQVQKLENDIFKAMQGEFRAAEEKHAYAMITLDREREQRDLAITQAQLEYERTKGLRGLSDAEAEMLREKEDQLHAAKQQNERDRADRDRIRALAGRDAESAALMIEMLGIDAAMAETARERIRLEREILRLTMEEAEKKARLVDDLDPELTGEARAARAAARGARDQGRLDLFDKAVIDEQRELFKSYAWDFIDAMKDGDLKDYFRSLAGSFLDRLMDRGLDGLFDAFSGKGGWLASAFKFIGGGRAAGGGVRSGFTYELAENGRPELALLGAEGHVYSAADTERLFREQFKQSGGGGSSLAVSIPISIDARGADPAAIARLEGKMTQVERELPGRIVQTVREAQERRVL